MRQFYRPAKWQIKIYKEHRTTCGCNRCFKKATKGHRIKEPPKLDYFEYIKSPQWLKRKEKYYKKHKKQCKACGTYKNIGLHHLKYGNLGKEEDYDLLPLCKACHEELHKIYGSSLNMQMATGLFIKSKQNRIRELSTELRKLDIHLTGL